MGQTAFTRAQARAKVGTRVRTCVAFAGVPQGVVVTITGADRVIDTYDVEVAWGGAERGTPGVDWLTKVEYETRFVELPSRGGSS
jgi:hypothetical protein